MWSWKHTPWWTRNGTVHYVGYIRSKREAEQCTSWKHHLWQRNDVRRACGTLNQSCITIINLHHLQIKRIHLFSISEGGNDSSSTPSAFSFASTAATTRGSNWSSFLAFLTLEGALVTGSSYSVVAGKTYGERVHWSHRSWPQPGHWGDPVTNRLWHFSHSHRTLVRGLRQVLRNFSSCCSTSSSLSASTSPG